MKHRLKISAVLSLLLFGAPAAQAQISFGFSFGTPPPRPRVYRVPPQPGPEFHWVEGHWYPRNGRWLWHDGYWTRPPFADHGWDRDRGRDANREWREHRDHDDRDRRR